MKLKKRDFFAIHSWIGIKMSILFFIVCFSGTIAVLSNELDWLFNPEMRAGPKKELADRNLIRDNLKKDYPGGVLTYWMKPEAEYLCDIVYVEEKGQRKYVFANPYTGKIQGEAQITVQRYFRDLHYFLFIPFQVGHFTVLAFAFLLLFSLLTALIFYKKWYRKLFILKTQNGPLVFFRSLHRLVGLWSIPFSILFALTGIWYFIERANVGNIHQQIRFEVPTIDLKEYDQKEWKELTYTVDYDRIIDSAQVHLPGLKVEKIGPPASPGQAVYVYGSNHVPLVRSRANRVYVNPISYEVLAVQNAASINTSMWLNDIADPLHFGYWGGLPAKIIWFIMGLGISSLVLSGIWIVVKRKARSRKKLVNKKSLLGIWGYINIFITILMFGFMYYFLIARYGVAWHVLLTVSFCWSLVIAGSYYVYIYRIRSMGN